MIGSTLYGVAQGGANDASGPWGAFALLDSKLYGTAFNGGTYNKGVIFSFTLPSLTQPAQETGPSAPSTPSCGNEKPSNAPDLFQIDVNNSQARLYFAPSAHADKYFISYGNGTSVNQYGFEFDAQNSDGVVSHTINHLQPNTKYTFMVRGGHGCMPGDWANAITVKTGKTANSGRSFYKDFTSRLLKVFVNE